MTDSIQIQLSHLAEGMESMRRTLEQLVCAVEALKLDGATDKARLSSIERDIERIELSVSKQWDAINALRKQVHTWGGGLVLAGAAASVIVRMM